LKGHDKMYVINVAKRYRRSWDNKEDLYSFYFRVETGMIDVSGTTPHGSTLLDLVEEMRDNYPSPRYNVSVSKVISYKEDVNI